MAKVDVEGTEMYVRAQDLDSLMAAKPSNAVRLLGGFEQWVLGPGTDETHIIPAARRSAVSRTAGWIAPIVIVGGVVSGTWSLDAERVAVTWFSESGRPPAAALGQEVDRLSRLVDRPLSLEISAA